MRGRASASAALCLRHVDDDCHRVTQLRNLSPSFAVHGLSAQRDLSQGPLARKRSIRQSPAVSLLWPSDFQFLVVKYDLSHERIDIGDTTPLSEIPGIGPARRSLVALILPCRFVPGSCGENGSGPGWLQQRLSSRALDRAPRSGAFCFGPITRPLIMSPIVIPAWPTSRDQRWPAFGER